ncbi:Ribosomal protein L6e family protein [Babesia bovis T2Bo]|uniref:Ribosomal protein L6e, putative n=1 Tax=Babesia bovis TaxID=5865 RepID=A7ASY7_BABBO|nr:Ribosomal protein L6e family protein [Babesia bovis T2Bo]EDO06048.1 Ribosomal protein L6e family protein [Babesia bovis T2Bo]BAN66057.1 ribosomal protein L6e, putative [Babesia bovis]BAN66145.1 ribosomal protein L6e, putative [Babesia bovis]|eukprot:XP_001609616.1 ribosomal protein L6e [Babesia bovis T2Bo]
MVHTTTATSAAGASDRSRKVANPPKIRPSLVPGTVLILLSGSYKGKRVVLLKVFKESGLLLVTGPFLFNGVPLRRVNPRYVIATSTNVFEMPETNGPQCKAAVEAVVSNLTDACFGKTKEVRMQEFKLRKKRSKDAMFIDNAEVEKVSDETKRKIKEKQDNVDSILTPFLKNCDILCQYLKTRFTLRGGMYPHKLKF